MRSAVESLTIVSTLTSCSSSRNLDFLAFSDRKKKKREVKKIFRRLINTHVNERLFTLAASTLIDCERERERERGQKME
jgi:hypothetical protein